MTGNQWQYVVVFLSLIGIAVWICYNLFSKKRRRSLPKCPSCTLNEVCQSVRKDNTSCDQRHNKECCSEKQDSSPRLPLGAKDEN